MTTARSAHPARLARLVLVLLALTLAPAGCGDDDASPRSQGPAASAVGTPDGLLTWIASHPANAGLAVLPDRGPALRFGAARRFPLASTRKVLIVGALAASKIKPSERIPRRAVERYYAPGTDAGAHARAQLDKTRPTVRQLARAAIEVSDNAAADALLERVGARAVDAWARRQGLAGQDPILPVFGELAAWTRDPRWTQRSPHERARRALAFAREVRARQVRLPPPADQRRLAASSVAGTPEQWAQLMHRIGRRGDPELVSLLDWPRHSKQVARTLDRYLTKGGSLPGVISEASYVRPVGGPGSAIALFLRDLPPDVERTLAKSFAQQKLIVRLATDPAFLRRARRLLRA